MGNKESIKGNIDLIKGNKESKCYFCGRKIGLNDGFYIVKEHIFCDLSCFSRFEMGDKDTCTNCNKKIFNYLLTAKGKENNDNFYFCSEVCFEKYNKRAKNKLQRVSSVCGGILGKNI